MKMQTSKEGKTIVGGTSCSEIPQLKLSEMKIQAREVTGTLSNFCYMENKN